MKPKIFQSIKEILDLLSEAERIKLIKFSVLQILLNLLDLFGVAMLGIIGAMTVNGVTANSPGSRLNLVLSLFHLENLRIQYQVSILGVITLLLLVGKTLISMILTRRLLTFLSQISLKLTSELTSKALSQNYLDTLKVTPQKMIFQINEGSNFLILGVLGLAVSITSDAFLLILLVSGLLFVSPLVGLITIAFFSAIGSILFIKLRSIAEKIGRDDASLYITSQEIFQEAMESYRETIVRNTRYSYLKKLQAVQENLASVAVDKLMLPNLSKYTLEVSLIVGVCIVAAIEFALADAKQAIATLAIFLAAGSRIAPASLRIQQSLIQIKTSLGYSLPTLELIPRFKEIENKATTPNYYQSEHLNFISDIQISELKFKFSRDSKFELDVNSLSLTKERLIAVVGPSGGGKTTLVDIILGVINQSSGRVTISGLEPSKALEKWPGAIGYVPQRIELINGTMLENIIRGFNLDEVPSEDIWNALELSALDDFVKSLPEGLNTLIGIGGFALSGGQIQRLGIARALMGKPALLILDEATSALDGETEFFISNALKKIKDSCKVIVIAHRLATVKDADLVIYIEDGKILGTGSFQQVRESVPRFDMQAQIMGLN